MAHPTKEQLDNFIKEHNLQGAKHFTSKYMPKEHWMDKLFNHFMFKYKGQIYFADLELTYMEWDTMYIYDNVIGGIPANIMYKRWINTKNNKDDVNILNEIQIIANWTNDYYDTVIRLLPFLDSFFVRKNKIMFDVYWWWDNLPTTSKIQQ